MTVNDSRFADLYDRYYGHVYAYCRRRVPLDRVEDAVADTFLTVWRRIEDVPEGEEALLWLYRVSYRVAGHVWRASSRARRLETKLLSLGMETHPPAEDFVITTQDEEQVVAAAARLTGKDEEVLRLAIWEHLTNRQIASILSIGEGAVKQRLHRAKKSLTREYNRLETKRTKSHAAQKGGAW